MSQAIAGSLTVAGPTTLSGLTAGSASLGSVTAGDLTVTGGLSAPSLTTMTTATLTAANAVVTGSLTAPAATLTAVTAGTVACTDVTVAGTSVATTLAAKANSANGAHTGTTSVQTLALGTGLQAAGTTVLPAELATLTGATGPLQAQLNAKVNVALPLLDQARLPRCLGLELDSAQTGLSRADVSVTRADQASAQGGEVVAATISSAGMRNEALTLVVPLGHRLQFNGVTTSTSYTYSATVGAPACRVYRNGTLFAQPAVTFSSNVTFPRTIAFSGAIGFTNPHVLDSGLAAATFSFTPNDGLTETNVYEVRLLYSSWSRSSNIANARISDGLIVNTTQGAGASWYASPSMTRVYTPVLPSGTSTVTAARASLNELTSGAVTCDTLVASGGIVGPLGSVSVVDVTSAGPVRVAAGAFLACPWQAGVLSFDGALGEPLNESTRVFWCSMKRCLARDDVWVCMPGWSASLYADENYTNLLVEIGARWALSPQVTTSSWGNNRVKSVRVYFNLVEQTLPTLS